MRVSEDLSDEIDFLAAMADLPECDEFKDESFLQRLARAVQKLKDEINTG